MSQNLLEKTFEVIIVGGGLLGKAIAYQLAGSGLNVAGVYRRGQSHGQASAAAGAMLGVFSEVSSKDTPDRRRLDVAQRWLARQLYADWVAGIRQFSDCPVYVQEGLFVIANPVGEDDALELAAIRDAAQDCERPAETVSARQLPGLEPQAGYAAFDALYLPDEGSVDTRQLLDALDVCLERHERVTLIDDRAASLTLTEAAGVSIRLESAEMLHGGQIVLAGGAELMRLIHASSLLDLAIPPIFSGRGVSLMAQTPITFPHAIRTPNRGFACGLHVVPRANGEVYIGATNRFSTTPDFDRKPSLSEINTLLIGAIQEINTDLKDAELLNVSVGHRPLTLDRLPLMGRTRDPRVLIASGTYRNGVLLTPLMAKLIAEEVLQPGRHAAHPFSPQRELKLASRIDPDGWLRGASKTLVATLSEPDGKLPNGRDKDLENVLYVLLSMLLNEDYDDRLLQKVQRSLQRAPLEENIPLLFELIARHASAN